MFAVCWPPDTCELENTLHIFYNQVGLGLGLANHAARWLNPGLVAACSIAPGRNVSAGRWCSLCFLPLICRAPFPAIGAVRALVAARPRLPQRGQPVLARPRLHL